MTPELTESQRGELAAMLMDRRVRLREEIAADLADTDDENLSALAGEVRDAGDASVADMLADLNLQHLARQTRELGRVERALADMASGQYGLCHDCGEPIRFERLQVEPEASRCLPCQERFEHTQRRDQPTL
ncbi:MAG TPA: TraR/DksA family transcriptional regulator [Gammaproteobacteria bacterium]|nr:TraR/DksA family transcriptional regulator [Gammaproteobacteria bacterium]